MKSHYYSRKQVGSRKGDWWNKDSEAGKLLKTGLKNGDIDPNDPPKTIWEAYPIFQQYDLAKFRVALNKLKSKMGCMICKKGSTDLNTAEENGKPYTIDSTIGVGRYNIEELDELIDENG